MSYKDCNCGYCGPQKEKFNMRPLIVVLVALAIAIGFSAQSNAELQKTPAQAYNEVCLTHLYTGCPLVR